MPHAVQYARRGGPAGLYLLTYTPATARKNLVLGRGVAHLAMMDALCDAMQAGVSAFLIDEDTCASNFMTRDTRMQQLVSPDKEPITPFVHRVRECMTWPG